ncbi:nuclear receptor subfamily 0, group B, member 2b [Pangasianodon hypophthalmus]|uniref:nuclear receptor subfamily 0, group B, member 2b n=1 Tax=Pangasianodon hypophthalmus TaxID=310915 RepID=UPI001479D6B0|nr:nuclear receptor subfamily 0, group B, member 2b [Pangasianodon hypophthalmus]
MYSSEEPKKGCYSRKLKEERSHTILFNILNRKDSCALEADDWSSVMHSCHCEQQRLVCLRNPESTCQAATEVLLKTMCFMKSLPSFHHLPGLDQFLLLRSHWVPLFVLGLAQERITFEVADFPMTSFLHKILLHDQNFDSEQEMDDFPPNLAAVHNLKSCLYKLWRLDLTPKEYAYLKGTILFNPDVPGLINCRLIEGLQREAQRLLHQVIHKLHPNDHSRLTSVLLAASSLHSVAQNLVTKLFFRRVIGQTDLLELLTEMLFTTGLF